MNSISWSLLLLLSLTLFKTSNAAEPGSVSDPTPEEEAAFCGKKPKTLAEETQAKTRARKLEQEMPPVQNQGDSNWCHVATGVALLDYHNMKNQKPPLQNAQTFYSDPKNLVSFIDFKAAVQSFSVENSTPDSSQPQTMDVDLFEGGYAKFGLLQIQRKNQIVRSQAQLPFEYNDKNKDSQAALESLINQYKSKFPPTSSDVITINGLKCPFQIYNNTEFRKQMRTFQFYSRTISNWLRERGQKNQSKISDYQKIAEEHLGRPDLKVRPFITKSYTGNNRLNFLKTIKPVVNKTPIQITLCGNVLLSGSHINSKTSCEQHEVVLVGAYYESGKCQARIRHSLGNDWNDKGHQTVPLKTLLNAQQALAESSKQQLSAFSATWIGSPGALEPGIQVDYTDTDRFEGFTMYKFKNNKSVDTPRKKGLIFKPGGKTEILFDGEKIPF